MLKRIPLNRLAGVGTLIIAGLIAGIACAQDGAAQSHRTITSVLDVIDHYDPDQHLYVKGDVGAAPQQLAELEKWLDENGPHWTIVLMKHARNESYQAQDGRTFRDMDAVEYALGHGLANRTRFGTLEHPETGETDGAVFVLFLEERKFSYYGSDAQDRRSVGESRWIGNLDREARSAMQNGGRIIDAAKNTVSDINARLKQAIAAEVRAEKDRQALEQRQKLERQRAVDTVRQRIVEAETVLIPELEKTLASFRDQFPDAATSSLATPPVADWQLILKNAAAKVAEANVRDTSQEVEQVIHQIHRMLDLHASHRAFDQSMAPVKRRWENVTFHSFGFAADSYSKEAEKLITQAAREHAAGDPAFAATTQSAMQAITQGESVVLAAVDAERIAQDRKRAVRRTLWIIAGVAGGSGLLVILVLNRRRRPALAAAHDAFDKSVEALGHGQEKIDQVLARRQQITGTLNEFRGRGFTGTTLVLAETIDQQCAKLAQITDEAHRVLKRATRLLNPVNPLAEAANMVSSSRYHACTRLLAGKSFNGSVALGSPVSNDHWVNPEEFLILSNDAASEAVELLNRLEDGLTNVASRMESLAVAGDQLSELQRGLELQSDADGHFPVRALEDILLPAIHQTQSEAETLATTDPVRVQDEYLPVVEQRIVNGLQIARSIRRMRDDLFPKLDAASDSMKSLGHRVQWIGERVVELGDNANQLCTLAAKENIADGADEFDQALSALAQRAVRCAELAATANSHRSTELEASRKNIANSRTLVSGQLRVATATVLTEAGHNPDDNLKNTEAHLAAAATAIDFGNADAAGQSLDAGVQETATADRIVRDTLRAVEQYSSSLASVRSHLQTTGEELPRTTGLADAAAQSYAPTAMRFRPEPAANTDVGYIENDSPEAAETIQSHLEMGQRLAGTVKETIDSAEELHKKAGILEAAFLMETSETGLDQFDQLLDRIRAHCTRLDSTAKSNLRGVSEVAESVTRLASRVTDPRCEQPTIDSHRELAGSIASLSKQLKTASAGRDPFLDEMQLQNFRAAVAGLSATIEGDFAAHGQATMAVQGAVGELEAVQRLVTRSVDDKIPDSSTISQSQVDARRLEQAVQVVSQRLERAHNDWQTVQMEATRLTAELGIVAGTLVRELQIAEQSAADFRQASGAVFRAARWTGAHGITVAGEPGSEELQRARRALSSGDYSAAIELCRIAASLAGRAVEIAQAAVDRRQRQIAAEAERRRRRMESSSSSIFSSSGGSSSGISFGRSSSSGRSWSSGSSSHSSSSSRSSGGGSGFSRSGW